MSNPTDLPMIDQSQNMMVDPNQTTTNNYKAKQSIPINQPQQQATVFDNDQNNHEIQTISDMNRLKQPNQSYTNRNLIIASNNNNNQLNDNNQISSLLHQPPTQSLQQQTLNSNIQILIPASQKSPQPQQQQQPQPQQQQQHHQQQPLFQKRYSNIQNQNNQNRHLYDRRTNSFPQMNVSIINKSNDELAINNNQISPLDNNLNIISPSSNSLQTPSTIISQMSPSSPIQMQFQNNMMQPLQQQQQQTMALLSHGQMYQHQNQNIRFQGGQTRGGGQS